MKIAGNSSWEDGDWNDDGDFTTSDLVLAFQAGAYQAAVLIPAPQDSLFDSENDKDPKKRLTLDPDSTDEIYRDLLE